VHLFDLDNPLYRNERRKTARRYSVLRVRASVTLSKCETVNKRFDFMFLYGDQRFIVYCKA